jgi:hypothetical protein
MVYTVDGCAYSCMNGYDLSLTLKRLHVLLWALRVTYLQPQDDTKRVIEKYHLQVIILTFRKGSRYPFIDARNPTDNITVTVKLGY